MKKLFIILTTLIFLIAAGISYAGSDPGLQIENKCEEKYPKESRETYNQPQYQLAYDRCNTAFSAYDKTLTEITEKMQIAYKTSSIDEFEKTDKLLESLATIIEINGEGLVGWLNRDILLQDIYYYRKKMQTEINNIKANRVPKQYIDIAQSQVESTNTSSGTTVKKESIYECKVGYLKNKKTGKCRKVFQIKKKEVTK